jgi:hypothetical protein
MLTIINMTDNLTRKQEQQLYDHIEERLQDMSHQDLLEVAREKLIDFYFDWGKAELINSNLIEEDND